MQTCPTSPPLEISPARGPEGWIEWNRRNYVDQGFRLGVIETYVGGCGLTMQEVKGTWLVEAGWHVHTPVRRQGYVAEAGGAVRVGFW